MSPKSDRAKDGDESVFYCKVVQKFDRPKMARNHKVLLYVFSSCKFSASFNRSRMVKYPNNI